jgi:hypothetical protein
LQELQQATAACAAATMLCAAHKICPRLNRDIATAAAAATAPSLLLPPRLLIPNFGCTPAKGRRCCCCCWAFSTLQEVVTPLASLQHTKKTQAAAIQPSSEATREAPKHQQPTAAQQMETEAGGSSQKKPYEMDGS